MPAPTRADGTVAVRPPEAGATQWWVRLLGRIEASDGEQRIERFPSRAVAALLARLALAPERAHAREELAELLWPGAAPDVSRNRLRQALSTLKSLLEPAGAPGRRVLDADRVHVRVLPGALGTDVRQFEALVQAGQATEALALYTGELMPGHYADWIDEERNRLADLHSRLLETQPALPALAAGKAGVPEQATAPEPQAASRGALRHDASTPRLPSYLTRLFGTELPTARLRAQVLGHRLVTLLGPGGAGKTRLAVEVATALRDPPGWAPRDETHAASGFDKVCFVSLVSSFSAAQLLDALARALRLPAVDTVAALVQALEGLHVLLVLDNLEQLVDTAAGTVAELLDGLPQLHVLATSRRRLGLDGEVLVTAEPLPLPAVDAPLVDAAANPAVALFVDRARAARSEFHLSARNQAAVIGLVRLLHGLPLAVELAASRVRSFAPTELLRLLQAGAGSGRLALLERSGTRSAQDPRHASMTAVIAWSWGLLDEEARRVLTALTLFPAHAGSTAVAAVSKLPLALAAGRLDDLVAHSLVRAMPGETSRFEPYEPVREFVTQQAGDTAAGHQRLRDWLLAWARGLPLPQRRTEVAAELVAVQRVMSQADAMPREALELAVALRDFWEADSCIPFTTLRLLLAAVDALPAHDPLRAESLELLAGLYFAAGSGDKAREIAERAVASAGQHPTRRARALVRQAWIDIAAGRAADRAQPRHTELRQQLDEALALAREAGDREVQARVLHQLGSLTGHVHASTGGADAVGAEAFLAQAQALWEVLGDSRRANARLRSRAQCWAHMGRLDEAMDAYRQCEQVAIAEGDWLMEIDCLISIVDLLAIRRQWAASLEVNRRCLALCWRYWHRYTLAYALWNSARVMARLRQPEAAIQLMAFSSMFWTSQMGQLTADDERHIGRVRALVVRQIGPARTEQLWQRGLALDIASAVRLVMPSL